MAKKAKAEAKRARRNKLKQGGDSSDSPQASNAGEKTVGDSETPDDAN